MSILKSSTFQNVVGVVLLIAIVCYKIYDTHPKDVRFGLKVKSYLIRKILFKFPKYANKLMGLFNSDIPVSEPDFFDVEKEVFNYHDDNIDVDVDLEMTVYTPVGVETADLPVLLFFHGGGFVMGNPDYLFPFMSKIAREKKMIVVCPQYRLRFGEVAMPSIYNDGYESLKWVVEKFGKDRKYMISGESAGGKMTIVVSQILRDNKYDLLERKNLVVAPIYPGVCNPECPFDIDEDLLNKGLIVNKHTFAVHKPDEARAYNPLANVNDLPNQFMVTCEWDVLKTEGKFYFDKVKEANPDNFNEFYEFKEEVHGFVNTEIYIDVENHGRLATMLIEKFEECYKSKEQEWNSPK